MKLSFPLSIILLLFSVPIYAEVILDGTLGSRLELPGPNYQISANLGQQYGSNLFHSFQYFNLQSFESATFSGSANINNIINRVTGGNPSNIDGLIRSTIPNANMYFLNPYGIMFGPNARLDIQGSFHASTAHYLRLGKNGRFDASQPNNSLLTVAPVSAFGFLDNTVAPISVEGSGEISETQWNGMPTGLAVPDGKTLSLIGGNLAIKSGTFFTTTMIFEDGFELTDIIPLGSLIAPYGRINLASVASKGEVIPTALGLDISTFDKLGNISVADKSFVNVSGSGGGDIFIRANQFFVEDSKLYAQTLEDKDGGVIEIQVGSVSLTRGSEMNASTQGTGRGSDISIQATNSITVSGENDEGIPRGIHSESGIWEELTNDELGDAGQIRLEAKNILFKEGALIGANTFGGGQGGDVTLKADESIIFSGENSYGYTSQIVMYTSSKKEKAGNAGTLLIEANNISFQDGTGILSHTAGKGKGGTVTLHAKEIIHFGGLNSGSSGSILAAEAIPGSHGEGGNFLIETKNLLLTDGASFITNAFGPGKAGNINIFATGTVTVNGTDGNGWNSFISSSSNPNFIENEDGSLISVTGGPGGDITLEAQKLVLKDGGLIASSSIAPEGLKSSNAGKITIKANSVEIIGVNPYGETEDGFGSGIYARSKGVEDNAGDAGEIFLETNSLKIKDGGLISSTTNSHANGGKINIRVNGKAQITGDSSKVSLKEPAQAQLFYQEDFEDYIPRDSISGIYASSLHTDDDAGQAGELNIQANTLSIIDGGIINSSTQNAGGGNITVTAPNLLYLQKSQITTSTLSTLF